MYSTLAAGKNSPPDLGIVDDLFSAVSQTSMVTMFCVRQRDSLYDHVNLCSTQKALSERSFPGSCPVVSGVATQILTVLLCWLVNSQKWTKSRAWNSRSTQTVLVDTAENVGFRAAPGLPGPAASQPAGGIWTPRHRHRPQLSLTGSPQLSLTGIFPDRTLDNIDFDRMLLPRRTAAGRGKSTQ